MKTPVLEVSDGRHLFFLHESNTLKTDIKWSMFDFIKCLLHFFFVIKLCFCLVYQRQNPVSMEVRISEGFLNLQNFIPHLFLSISPPTFI